MDYEGNVPGYHKAKDFDEARHYCSDVETVVLACPR
jgi:hypothetical protein